MAVRSDCAGRSTKSYANSLSSGTQSLTERITQVYKGWGWKTFLDSRLCNTFRPVSNLPAVELTCVALKGITMNLRAAKWLVMSLVTVSAFAFASASTEAEACCGLFQCLFGWCGGCRNPCYSPCAPAGGCGPSGCPTSSYYGPVVYRGCAPCASSCAPCGIASAGCASGDCSLGSSSTSMPPAPTPEPNDNWDPKKKQKKTFADPPDGNLGPNGRPTGSGSGSQNKQDDDSAYKKARTEETETNDQQGSLSPASKKADSASSKASKKGPAAPKASEKEDPDSSRAPTISVDEKVAWRNAPARTRVESRPRTVSARIVRLPAYPKSDWLPVEGDSKVAKN